MKAKHVPTLMLALSAVLASGPQVWSAEEAPATESRSAAKLEERAIVAIPLAHLPAGLVAGWITSPVTPSRFLSQGAKAKPPVALPEGVDAIVPSESTNELWVRGTPDGIRFVSAFVAAVDKPLRRVEIRLRAVRVSRADFERLGIDMATGKGVFTMNLPKSKPDTTPGRALALGFVRDGAFEPALSKVIASGQGSALMDARLVAANNATATIQTSSQPLGGKSFEAQMTPTINNDNTITVLLQASAATAPGDPKVTTVFNVRDGGTIVAVMPDKDEASERITLAIVTPRILPLEGAPQQ